MEFDVSIQKGYIFSLSFVAVLKSLTLSLFPSFTLLSWVAYICVSCRLTTVFASSFPLDLLMVHSADTAQYCTVLLLV